MLDKLIRKPPMKKLNVDSKSVQIRSLLEKMRESVDGRSRLEEFRSRIISNRINRGRKRKLTQSPPRSRSEESFNTSLPSNMNDSSHMIDSFEMQDMSSFEGAFQFD